MKPAGETGQAGQRVRVALTGLALVVVLIWLASLVARSVSRERPVAAPGASRPDLVANLSAGNDSDPSEPLAELGVTPSSQGNDAAPAAQ
jgi:hypothetical protein